MDYISSHKRWSQGYGGLASYAFLTACPYLEMACTQINCTYGYWNNKTLLNPIILWLLYSKNWASSFKQLVLCSSYNINVCNYLAIHAIPNLSYWFYKIVIFHFQRSQWTRKKLFPIFLLTVGCENPRWPSQAKNISLANIDVTDIYLLLIIWVFG